MTVSRFFEWFLFSALACWGALGVTRALWLRARGVRIIAVDRQRSGREMLADLLAAICLLVLGCEIVAHAWSVGFPVGPKSLDPLLADIRLRYRNRVCAEPVNTKRRIPSAREEPPPRSQTAGNTRRRLSDMPYNAIATHLMRQVVPWTIRLE